MGSFTVAFDLRLFYIDAFEEFSYKTPIGVWMIRACDHKAVHPMVEGITEGRWNPYLNGCIPPSRHAGWQVLEMIYQLTRDVKMPVGLKEVDFMYKDLSNMAEVLITKYQRGE